MRTLTYLATLAIAAVPAYWNYDLNKSVQYLRHHDSAVPFFAYYRYGVMTDSVVFNVTGANCNETLTELMPAFEAFVREMRYTPGITEVRLAWEGETIAVLPQSALENRWQLSQQAQPINQDPLAAALGCSSEGSLVVDWARFKPNGSAIT